MPGNASIYRHTDVDALRKRVQGWVLSGQPQANKNALLRLQRESASLEQQLQNSQQLTSTKNAEIVSMRSELNQRNTELRRRNAHEADLTQRIANLEQRLRTKNKEVTNKNASFQQQLAQAKALMNEASDQALADARRSVDVQLKVMQEDLRAAEARHTSMQQHHATEMQRLQTTFAAERKTLTDETEAAKRNINRIKAELQNATKKHENEMTQKNTQHQVKLELAEGRLQLHINGLQEEKGRLIAHHTENMARQKQQHAEAVRKHETNMAALQKTHTNLTRAHEVLQKSHWELHNVAALADLKLQAAAAAGYFIRGNTQLPPAGGGNHTRAVPSPLNGRNNAQRSAPPPAGGSNVATNGGGSNRQQRATNGGEKLSRRLENAEENNDEKILKYKRSNTMATANQAVPVNTNNRAREMRNSKNSSPPRQRRNSRSSNSNNGRNNTRAGGRGARAGGRGAGDRDPAAGTSYEV